MRRSAAEAAEAALRAAAAGRRRTEEATWQDIMPVDTLGLEVGYRLIPLVDKTQGGELLKRIKGIRKKFAQEVGFLAPPVHIRDNLELKPSAYRITLKGVEVGSGEAINGQFLAINPGMASGTLPGLVTTDPAFGLPATWIDAGLRDEAQSMGYTVVDAGTVVATHLNHLITTHASELLGRWKCRRCSTTWARKRRSWWKTWCRKWCRCRRCRRCCRTCWSKACTSATCAPSSRPVRACGTPGPERPDGAGAHRAGPRDRAAAVPGHQRAVVMTLDNRLERLLMQALGAGGDGTGIEPGLADTIAQQAHNAAQQQERWAHAGAAGAGAAARAAVALPAPRAAAAEGAVAFGDSGDQDHPRDQPGSLPAVGVQRTIASPHRRLRTRKTPALPPLNRINPLSPSFSPDGCFTASSIIYPIDRLRACRYQSNRAVRRIR
jgi:flagellar biosynthesis protein FlhA